MARESISRLRTISVHIMYMLYSAFLWWRLVYIGEQTGHSEMSLTVALAIWFCFYLFAQIFVIFSALGSSPHELLKITWCNIPMLIFIVFNLPPYGFTLNHMYKLTEKRNAELIARNVTSSEISDEAPLYDFILLQLVMLVLLITYILYPLPKRAYILEEYLAIAVEFMNAFDIMDMISDIHFIRSYGLGWVIMFYMSLGMSSVLLAFPIKIENDDFNWPEQIVVCASISDDKLNEGENKPKKDETNGKRNQNMQLEDIETKSSDQSTDSDQAAQDGKMQFVDIELNPNDVISAMKKAGSRSRTNSFQVPAIIKTHDEDVFASNNEQTDGKLNPNNNNISHQRRSSIVSCQYVSTKSQEARITADVWKKIVKVVATMIFTDLMFAIMRLKILIEENSAEHGFNMFVKNIILACLHMFYLLRHAQSVRLSKRKKC